MLRVWFSNLGTAAIPWPFFRLWLLTVHLENFEMKKVGPQTPLNWTKPVLERLGKIADVAGAAAGVTQGMSKS